MGVMILTVLHYVLCFGLILIVLLQAGKGGGLAAAFGGGSSETIFGARRGNILTKVTAVGVSLFMITSLLLVIILPKQVSMVQKKGLISEDKMRDVKMPQVPGLPVGVPPPAQTTPGAPPAPGVPPAIPPIPDAPTPAPVTPEAQPQAPPAAPAVPPAPAPAQQQTPE